MAQPPAQAPNLDEFLMPNVHAIGTSADEEITNIRDFMQMTAVKFNTLVHETVGMINTQKGLIEQVHQEVPVAQAQAQNNQNDMKVMRDIVNGSIKDTTQKVIDMGEASDASNLQAQFRVASIEAELTNVKADTTQRMGVVDSELKAPARTSNRRS